MPCKVVFNGVECVGRFEGSKAITEGAVKFWLTTGFTNQDQQHLDISTDARIDSFNVQVIQYRLQVFIPFRNIWKI